MDFNDEPSLVAQILCYVYLCSRCGAVSISSELDFYLLKDSRADLGFFSSLAVSFDSHRAFFKGQVPLPYEVDEALCSHYFCYSPPMLLSSDALALFPYGVALYIAILSAPFLALEHPNERPLCGCA